MYNYRTYQILFFYLFIFSPLSKAQIHTNTITGRIKKVLTGKVYLFPAITDRKYYNKSYKIDSANIYDGKFIIKRIQNDNDIYPYRVSVKSNLINGTTNLVFLSPKTQVIIIDSINEHISPTIKNSVIQNEMKYGYDKFFEPLVQEVEDLENYSDKLYENHFNSIPEDEKLKITTWGNELRERGDSLFLEYAKTHPHSYITLWKLIERFKNLGYKKEYLDVYNLLSNGIKETSAASYLLDDLQNAKTLGLSSSFPTLQLKTENQNSIKLDLENYKANYILIDFWFSSCTPCLRQFPKYKTLYDEYKISGFEIIGISIDKKDDLKNWKKIIKEQRLNWINYWDEDGLLSEKLGINSFPTNFLLNAKGEIIKKNISPEELQNFMGLNLKIIDNIDNSCEPL